MLAENVLQTWQTSQGSFVLKIRHIKTHLTAAIMLPEPAF